jgi:hypothetical protein
LYAQLPKHRHSIGCKVAILRNRRKGLRQGLGDEQTIERVSMMFRKLQQHLIVPEIWGDYLKPVGQNCAGKNLLIRNVQNELAQPDFDRDFPRRSMTDPCRVALVLDRPSGGWAELLAALQEPKQRMGVEQQPQFI